MCRSLCFAPIAKRSSGSIYWDHVLVDGASEHHPEGKYYIEWYEEEGRRRKSVGTIPSDVLAAAQRKRAELNAKDAGIAPAKTESAPAQRLLAGDAVERYLRDVNMNKAESTFTHYRHSLTLFKQSLTKATVDAIDPDDMMDFQAFLYKQGLSARTVKLIPIDPQPKVQRTPGICLSGRRTDRGTDTDVCTRPTFAGLSIVTLFAIIATQCPVDPALGTYFHGPPR